MYVLIFLRFYVSEICLSTLLSAGKEGYFDPWAKFFNAKLQCGKNLPVQVINP